MLKDETEKSGELTAHRPGGGESASLRMRTSLGERLGQGFIGKVARLMVDRGEGREPLIFAHKYFDSLSPRNVKRQVQVHDRLIRLPHGQEFTPATFRATEEGILMTDLSRGGREMVLSGNDSEHELEGRLDQIKKHNPTLVERFLKTDVFDDGWLEGTEDEKGTWIPGFYERIDLIARETAQAKVWLKSGDSIFFVLESNGDYKLEIVDMDNVEYTPDFAEEGLYARNIQQLEKIEGYIRLLWLKCSQIAKE